MSIILKHRIQYLLSSITVRYAKCHSFLSFKLALQKDMLNVNHFKLRIQYLLSSIAARLIQQIFTALSDRYAENIIGPP